jgi:N-acetylmuramoyl-L-alanine amidase
VVAGCARTDGASPTTTPSRADTVPNEQTTSLPPVDDPTSTSTSASTSSTLGQARLLGKVIVVDPGHNGANGSHLAEINQSVFIGNGSKECDTTGTATADGYDEFEFTMDVARRLRTILEAEGADVVLTRGDSAGWGPCITERAAIGNDADADLAISIHADGGPASGRGFHVLLPAPVVGYNDGIVEPSATFGRVLRDVYRRRTGMPTATYIGTSGLMVRSDLGGLNLSRVPKVFLECGNMRNGTDAGRLEDPSFRETIAAAVAEAMTTHLLGQG